MDVSETDVRMLSDVVGSSVLVVHSQLEMNRNTKTTTGIVTVMSIWLRHADKEISKSFSSNTRRYLKRMFARYLRHKARQVVKIEMNNYLDNCETQSFLPILDSQSVRQHSLYN